LFDAKEQKDGCFRPFAYDRCAFVLSTSPRRELINDFQKPPHPRFFYMPTWTEVEMKTISLCFPTVIDWRNRFEILGGIPRLVLEDSEDARLKLQLACENCNLKKIFKVIGLKSTITDKSKVIHSLIHMASTVPFTQSSVNFASQTALDIIVRNIGQEAKNNMSQLLASCAGNPLTASLCGYIFEPYAIDVLEKGGTFVCRELVHSNRQAKPRPFKLTIPPSVRIIVDKPARFQKAQQLYLPKTKNYTAIDAWIPKIGAFQITVGKEHSINPSVGNDLEILGRGAAKLYFVLPPLYFDTFPKKNQPIQQYAMKIPYPTHSIGNSK
jgi:hypothetical protein